MGGEAGAIGAAAKLAALLHSTLRGAFGLESAHDLEAATRTAGRGFGHLAGLGCAHSFYFCFCHDDLLVTRLRLKVLRALVESLFWRFARIRYPDESVEGLLR